MRPEVEDAVEGGRGTLPVPAGAASFRPGGCSAFTIGKATALEKQSKLKKLDQHKNKIVFDCSTVEIVGRGCVKDV